MFQFYGIDRVQRVSSKNDQKSARFLNPPASIKVLIHKRAALDGWMEVLCVLGGLFE